MLESKQIYVSAEQQQSETPPQMGLEPTIPGLGGQCLIH